jgi:hypothetical protein
MTPNTASYHVENLLAIPLTAYESLTHRVTDWITRPILHIAAAKVLHCSLKYASLSQRLNLGSYLMHPGLLSGILFCLKEKHGENI